MINLRVIDVLVSGRVQGVGFRWFVLRSARALGVSGWVRNTDDGEVEVHAAGESARVDEFLSVVRHGSAHAVVQAVEVEERPATDADVSAEFEIIP